MQAKFGCVEGNKLQALNFYFSGWEEKMFTSGYQPAGGHSCKWNWRQSMEGKDLWILFYFPQMFLFNQSWQKVLYFLMGFIALATRTTPYSQKSEIEINSDYKQYINLFYDFCKFHKIHNFRTFCFIYWE